MVQKKFSVLALMVVCSMLLASCGGTAANTPVPATVAPTAMTADMTPTAMMAGETPTAMMAGTTPTAMMAGMTPTAMMAGETPTAMMTGGTPGAAMTPGSSTMDWSKVGQEIADAYAGKLTGKTVTMFGPFTAEDEIKFNNSTKAFTAATGITIKYEGSKEFETTVLTRVKGGAAPDIADFPQPGLLSTLAKTGKVLDASKFLNSAWMKQNYNQSFLDIATIDNGSGTKILGGVFQRVNGKSLVWYPKKEFDAAGYTIPQTWDEMKTLMDKMVADGTTPWCIGIESGTATGWAATDWIEDIMLRTTSLDNYDKWVQGTLPFTSPEVKKAAQTMADIWLNPKYVYGGTKQIVNTSFGDSVKPMFENPPKCYLHRQGNFITSFFEQAKAGVKGGTDYDFFYLPQIDPQYGKPFLFAGDIMSAFNDRPEVRAVMQWFSTFEGVKGWVQAGGALAPQNDADPKAYTSQVDARVAGLIQSATSLRFDGSDQMPGAVGAGSFWKAMTNYVSGNEDIDKALEEAQAGWANVQK